MSVLELEDRKFVKLIQKNDKAAVYIVKDKHDIETVIKVSPKHRKTEYSMSKLLLNRNNAHKNIVKVFQSYILDDKWFVIEYEKCVSDMFKFILINWDNLTYYFKSLLSAIQYLHVNNVVHMDIKLENILMREDGSICLCDFDLSINMKPGYYNQGTTEYKPPEILNNEYIYNPDKCDIYSAGMTMLVMTHNDYDEETIEWIQLPENNCTLHELIISMINKDPSKRPSADQCLDHVYFNRETNKSP
jgi:serine/threonine protein kinase